MLQALKSSLGMVGGLTLAAALSIAGTPSRSQAPGVLDAEVGQLNKPHASETVGIRNGSFVVAPIPFSNPTIGSGLILGAGYLFQLDEGSDPSVIGAAVLRSDNGSQAAGAALNLYLHDNRWIIKTLFARADVQYDLYTGAGILPVRQDGVLGQIGVSYGVTPDLSFGPSFRYLDTTVAPAFAGLPPIPPPFDQFLEVEILNVGLVADWDTRDDTIYPTRGHALHVSASRGIALSGLVQDYNKGYVNYSRYFPVSEKGVLAARASVCAASAEAPFFDQCGLGTTDGFRGFSATQFLDLRAASLQLEYRHRFTKRLGGVAFGGVGQVGPEFSELDAGGTHSAYGIGARYRVSRKFPLDFSVDVSRNSEQENTLYIYVGQRF
ncbi:MAG: BamA/TamA family outer membrane protein [Ruegeria sp.]|uniref:BamA/TamA family outer membrane protein n=1 Tax=Ruegeria sp. TaxID=1879320 RepID=UPI00349E83D5